MEDEVNQVEVVVEETVVNLSSSPPVDDSADVVESLPSDDHDDNHPDTVAASSSDDLEDKITTQVEYYFSEENVSAKSFYKKYVRSNKEGFVPIEAIASFRKMKKLTRDIPFITNALRKSSFLALNPEGTMVKSLHPLSFLPNEPMFCTVLVENLPGDHSKENIQKIFGQAGNIKSISICDPHSIEESTKVVEHGRLISGKVHALVEYDSVEAAEKAVATLNDAEDWRNGMRVVLLSSRLRRGSKKISKVPTSEVARDEGSHNPSNHHETADEGALNPEGTMVKSLHPLSFLPNEPKFCTVLVENLPGDHSKENIQKIFGQAGNIKSISICDPHSIEESTKVVECGRLISGKVHALVEYDSVEAAEKAVATLNDAEDWRNGMRVVLLSSRLRRGSKKTSKVPTSEAARDEGSHNPSNHHETADDGDGRHLPKEKPKEKNGWRNQNYGRSRGQTSRAANGHGHGTLSSSLGTEHMKPSPGPRMPDGTRGFTLGRGRPVVPSPN